MLLVSSSSSSSGSGDAVGTAVIDPGASIVDVGSIAESEMSVAPTLVGLPVSCGCGKAVVSAARALIRKTTRMLLGRALWKFSKSVFRDETLKPLFVLLHLFIYQSAARLGTFLKIHITFQCSPR